MDIQKCNICKLELPIGDFVMNNMYGSGYSKRCKPCARNYEKIKKQNEDNPNITPLSYCNDPDAKKGAEDVLRGLGYELYNPESSVYSQFKERLSKRV
jgi:hypothetical protein